jgi:hypothetical protein
VNRRWMAVYGYLVVLFIVTPHLPLAITWARGRWQDGSVAGFVLAVEIAMGAALILAAGLILFSNRSKFQRFFLLIAGLIGFSCLFYRILPNPYELTHIPEYAVLSLLLIHAMKPSSYLYAAAITVMFGAVDELYQGLLPLRYFTWYDIVLNGLGGMLGLTIFWGVARK